MSLLIRHIFTLATIFALISASASAGTTGMVEMLNLTGARQAAMGEVALLFDPDPFNLEYQPAAMGNMERGRLGFSHNSFIQDRSTDAVAAVFPLKGADLGLHMRLSSLGDIEARGTIPTSEPDYTFSAYDFGAKAFAAFHPWPRFSVGISAGWLMEKIDYNRAHTLALGLGGRYDLMPDLAAHASVANVGPDFSYISEKQDPPTIYRAGMAYRKEAFCLAADYVNIKSGDGHWHFGGEYLLEQMLYLRAGCQTGYDSRAFSAGAGFLYCQFRIDYAFVPYESDLGNSHQFTLTVLL